MHMVMSDLFQMSKVCFSVCFKILGILLILMKTMKIPA